MELDSYIDMNLYTKVLIRSTSLQSENAKVSKQRSQFVIFQFSTFSNALINRIFRRKDTEDLLNMEYNYAKR